MSKESNGKIKRNSITKGEDIGAAGRTGESVCGQDTASPAGPTDAGGNDAGGGL